MKYFKYLEMVQESVPEDYPEISDLLNRYNTLKDANVDLTKRQAMHERENDERRTAYTTFGKDKANDVLNFNNEIASLQKKLEISEHDVLKVQNDVDVAVRSTSDKTLELGQVFMAIGNLLQRCTGGIHGAILKHSENTTSLENNVISTTNITEQNTKLMIKNGKKAVSDLQVIAAYMTDFRSIVEEQKKKIVK